MECITVLKTPERNLGNILPTKEIQVEGSYSGASRLCSHKNQTFIHGMILLLLCVLFISQLYLHLQLLQKEKDIAHLQDKVQALLTAREIDQINHEGQIKLKNGISTNHHETHKDKSSKRTRRNGQCRVPHFMLSGHNEQGTENEFISETGIFFWKNNGMTSGAFSEIQNHSGASSNIQNHSAEREHTIYLDGVRVLRTGTYHIFAQVHVDGREDALITQEPSVGIVLKRDGQTRFQRRTEELTKAFITQENKGNSFRFRGGHSYGKRFPVDVLQLEGLFFLNEGDIIYIAKPDDDRTNNRIRYNNKDTFAHFYGYLVESSGSCTD